MLYVDDLANNTVDVLKNHSWKVLNTITDGIDGPAGIFMDRHADLLVANAAGHNVTEYEYSGQLEFTYTAGIKTPNVVTADKLSAVFEGDANDSVSELPPHQNQAITCATPGPVYGIAVDQYGNVYASVGGQGGKIIYFPRGLIYSGCGYGEYTIKFSFPYGIALDKQRNLIVCDMGAKTVDIVAPNGTTIGTLGSGWSAPTEISIDREGTEAFVTDQGTRTVEVLTYPGGVHVASIGSANGITSPQDAVSLKNYAP